MCRFSSSGTTLEVEFLAEKKKTVFQAKEKHEES